MIVVARLNDLLILSCYSHTLIILCGNKRVSISSLFIVRPVHFGSRAQKLTPVTESLYVHT